MKNQHKVIPILAGILFSDGILAQSAGGELYPKKPSMPSTDTPAVSKKAESLNKNEFVKFDQQLAATSVVAKTPSDLFNLGNSYLNTNTQKLGVSKTQLDAHETVLNYRASDLRTGLSDDQLEALDKVSLDGSNLKDFVVAAEGYSKAIKVFNAIPDSSHVSESIINSRNDVKFISAPLFNNSLEYENTKKEFYDSQNKMPDLGKMMYFQVENLKAATKSAFSIALPLLAPEINAAKNAYSTIKSTKDAVNTLKLIPKILDLIESLNDLSDGNSNFYKDDKGVVDKIEAFGNVLATFDIDAGKAGSAALSFTNNLILMKTLKTIDKSNLSEASIYAMELSKNKLIFDIFKNIFDFGGAIASKGGAKDIVDIFSNMESQFVTATANVASLNIDTDMRKAIEGKKILDDFTVRYVSATKSVIITLGLSVDVQKEKEATEKESKDKNNKLISKSIDIKQEEKVIRDKQEELDDKKKELANTDKYINIHSENTQTSYDQKKLAYLQEAQELVDKYGRKSKHAWSDKDWKRLFTLAVSIGAAREDLYSQLKQGNFNSLRDKFVPISTRSSSVEKTIENLDYKDIEGQISALTNEIKTLNQELTLDKMQQSDLKMSVNNLRDVNNTIKVTETQNNQATTSSHIPYLSGLYTENMYYENNLGEPVNSGFADGPAELNSPILDQGDSVYFYNPPPSSDLHHTEVLNQAPANYYGSYDYVAWGAWSDPDRAAFTKVYTSHWVVVDKVEIDRDQKPRTGTARYEGELQGTLWTIGQDNSYHNANGDILLKVNFGDHNALLGNEVIGAHKVTGDINVFNADTQAPFASASFNTDMNTSSDGLSFQGPLTGVNGSILSNQETWHSNIHGYFGGNQAVEAGGVWAITKGNGNNGDDQATGVFRAKKQ